MSGMFQDAAPLRRDGSESGDAAEAVPITAVEPDGHARGGIVVLHEAREFTPPLLELMRALAGEGWIAVAPALFHREPVDSDAEVFGDNLFADFDACFDWLVGRGVFADCIGTLGFDDAGTAAFLVATNRPIGAAVSVAPRGIARPIGADAPALVDAAPSLQAPWLGLFGSDDPETPTEHVDQLREAVATAAVAADVVSYAGLEHRPDRRDGEDAGSGAEDTGFDRDEEALVEAQARIFGWFDSNLR